MQLSILYFAPSLCEHDKTWPSPLGRAGWRGEPAGGESRLARSDAAYRLHYTNQVSFRCSGFCCACACRSLAQPEDAGAYLDLLLPSYKALPEDCIQKAR